MEIRKGAIEAWMLHGVPASHSNCYHNDISVISPRIVTKQYEIDEHFPLLNNMPMIRIPDDWTIYVSGNINPLPSHGKWGHYILSYLGWQNCQQEIKIAFDETKNFPNIRYNYDEIYGKEITDPDWNDVLMYFEKFYSKMKKRIAKRIALRTKELDVLTNCVV